MIERLIEWMDTAGYAGIAALMFLENLFPPLPSELIMPSAGFAAARGDLNLAGVVLAGSAGSVAGALFWYYVGKWFGHARLRRGAERHGRWLTVRPADVDRAHEWFGKYCGPAVFVGRLVPAVRTLISVPAGVFEMSLGRFLLYSTLGTVVWTGALAGAGYGLAAQYDAVGKFLNPVGTGIFAILVAIYLYRLVTWRNGTGEAPAG